MNQCSHDNAVQEGDEMYCPDCNTYFSYKDMLTPCSCCGVMLDIGEVCWCLDKLTLDTILPINSK